MKTVFLELWQQVKEPFGGREWFLGLGTLIVVCLWLSFGSPAFFMKTWGASFAGDPYVDWYQYLYYHLNALLLLGVLPVVVLRFGFGMKLSEMGICLGDWRFGLKFLAVAIPLSAPVLYLSSLDPAFQREYPLTKLAGQTAGTWVLWELTYLLYYIGWEVYFRGALLFGLEERIGAGGALLFQTAISTLVHIGKPVGELVGAAPGGLLIGALALRTRSVLWPLLFHWYMGATMDVLAFVNGTR